MAIEMIQEIFPGAAVSWERTGRVRHIKIVVTAFDGELVASVDQHDFSDYQRGPGVEELKQRLEEMKK